MLELEFKSKQSNFTIPIYNFYSKESSSEVKQKEGGKLEKCSYLRNHQKELRNETFFAISVKSHPWREQLQSGRRRIPVI